MRSAFTYAALAAVCAGVFWLEWRAFGSLGLVFGAPLFALFAKPLLEVVEGAWRLGQRLAWRDVAGRYVEFRGRAIDIHVDADARCWVCTADARKIVALPADEVLGRLVPGDCGECGDPARWRITVDGLAQVLARSSDPAVTKFIHWLETQVARPARNRRDGRRVPG